MASFPTTRLVLKNISCIGSPASLKTLELLIGIVLSVVLVLLSITTATVSLLFSWSLLCGGLDRDGNVFGSRAHRAAQESRKAAAAAAAGEKKTDAELRSIWL